MSPARDWETTFRSWARPPSDTEDERCENAVRMIKDAITASRALAARDVQVFGHGSYRNNTNVRLNSDVDVCVRCMDVITPDYSFAAGATDREANLVEAVYTFAMFKNELEAALHARFGSLAVVRGNKVFVVRENTYRVSADVAPTSELRRYYRESNGRLWYESGTMLYPDRGPCIENWPHHHYQNGVGKNDRTGRRFKSAVRILKRLRNDMEEARAYTGPVPSYLLECLVWNVPDQAFCHATLTEDVRQSIAYLVASTATQSGCNEWGEVNERKYVFRVGQKWTREEAHAFLVAAWGYLGT